MGMMLGPKAPRRMIFNARPLAQVLRLRTYRGVDETITSPVKEQGIMEILPHG